VKHNSAAEWHTPKGFLFSGIHCGVKKKRKDLALFYSNKDCNVSALFTRNAVKAAPVALAQEQLARHGQIRAVVVNSGNANCMTGKRGLADARKMVKAMSKTLGLKAQEVLVSSTGIIGQYMDMKPILAGMKPLALGLSCEALSDAADGIMTTDLFRKISSRKFHILDKEVVITGVAKGAGMIKPDMATMLGYIMTDANITKKALEKALRKTTDLSFNAITVDGDMSTNDTVILMANGEADNRIITGGGRPMEIFQDNLNAVTRELASMIVKDGEGASKFIEVRVHGAKDDRQAKKVAGAIADSLLVKCAVAGGDPNWGRIASSAGASGVRFDPEKMDIKLDGIVFLKAGKASRRINRKSTSVFKGSEVLIEVDLHSGKGKAVFYSCDITKKYITLNSYYTT
jgi:glutamate N-acetyltransferase / amino-acid N-acetyltransferase